MNCSSCLRHLVLLVLSYEESGFWWLPIANFPGPPLHERWDVGTSSHQDKGILNPSKGNADRTSCAGKYVE